MSTHAVVAVPPPNTSIIEEVITKGDLKNLTARDRVEYYRRTCESLGLNPLTRPFEYLTLRANGPMVLYATKGATDQLRRLNRVDVRIVSREQIGDVYVVTAEARTPDGRTDSDIGVVTIKGLGGDALANALMKATTKSKRRVTLSICGLGWLDESEVETVPSARVIPIDTETGEMLDTNTSLRGDDTERAPAASVDESPSPEDPKDPAGLRRDFFAVAKKQGITAPDVVKALCTAMYPSVESRASYTGAMWADAIAWVTDEANAATVARFRDQSWLARLDRCTSEADLGELATALGQSGQATDAIRAAFRVRRDELQAAARLMSETSAEASR